MESEKVKELLIENNVPFSEVFSNSVSSEPVLMSSENAQPFKGLFLIKEYLQYLKETSGFVQGR